MAAGLDGTGRQSKYEVSIFVAVFDREGHISLCLGKEGSHEYEKNGFDYAEGSRLDSAPIRSLLASGLLAKFCNELIQECC
jgi:hypothetical protein